jgi:phosphopantothenoylcysteine decarboxylase / phosphopantothenate---cysteine ligase
VILLYVGPAPGALAAPEIARGLRTADFSVEVVLEERTNEFIGPAAFEGAVSAPGGDALEPAAVVYAPATAGTLARLAHGLGAGDMRVEKAVVAPDLDEATAGHPAVQENLRRLAVDGCRVVGGTHGGMASAGEVVAAVLGSLGGALDGLRLVVTAGGTREPIDGVRFVGNRSSGKMGRALAREAARMGAEVTMIAANAGEPEPGVGWVDVETVDELEEAVLAAVVDADALVMAAAVSDFKPAESLEGKIRRSGNLTVEFEPTTDVLRSVTVRYPELYVVGFAATHGDPVEDAREKLGKKGVDLVVGNDISGAGIGFGSEENEVYLVGRDVERFVPRASKTEVARVILEAVAVEAREKGGVGP